MASPFDGIDAPTVQILGLAYPKGREGQGKGMEGNGREEREGKGMEWKGWEGKRREEKGIRNLV